MSKHMGAHFASKAEPQGEGAPRASHFAAAAPDATADDQPSEALDATLLRGGHFAKAGEAGSTLSADGDGALAAGLPLVGTAADEVDATDTASDADAPRKPSAARKALIALLSLTLLAALAYGAGAIVFTNLFLPNTTLNGEDVSLRSVREVAAEHDGVPAGYTLAIEGEGMSLTVEGADVGLSSDGTAFVAMAREGQNPWLWPADVTGTHALRATEQVTLDETLLRDRVGKAVDALNEGATAPVDAKLAYDKDTHLYAITPDQPGTMLDADAIAAQARAALLSLEPTLELGEDALAQAAVTADDPQLVAQVEAVNAHLGATQRLVVGENEVFEVGPDLIAGWTKVADDLSVTVDREALTKWAQGDLSKKLDSAGADHSYTRPDGKQVSVSGGDYGWIIDGATLAGQIADNIESGTAATLEVPMLQTAASWNPGGQEWGKRYIDIDLSEQHVRMYDGGGALIWESDCVTGNPNTDHATPRGVYQLNDNREQGNVKLEGPIDKKTNEPEYVSYVTYWMPFIWNAVALHDATWRYSFGGDIYTYDGSHGCVNLPYDKAEQLFGICRVGDVVVVHG